MEALIKGRCGIMEEEAAEEAANAGRVSAMVGDFCWKWVELISRHIRRARRRAVGCYEPEP
jgi:hypothetical protein